jgi:hypothetical protein
MNTHTRTNLGLLPVPVSANRKRRKAINPALLLLLAIWAGIAITAIHTEGCTLNPAPALR